jgi:hypothetical protein
LTSRRRGRSWAFAASTAFTASTASIIDHHYRLTDLGYVSLFHQDLYYFAPSRSRNLDVDLVGHDFHNGLVFFDLVPLLRHPLQNFTFCNPFADVWHLEFQCQGRTNLSETGRLF